MGAGMTPGDISSSLVHQGGEGVVRFGRHHEFVRARLVLC